MTERPVDDLREVWPLALKILEENPEELFSCPRIRSYLSAYRYEKYGKSQKLLSEVNRSAGRTNTAEYNLKGLSVGSALDRGSCLFGPLVSQPEFQDFTELTRVLCLGPRNEAELLAALGYGIKEENLKGLDLLSYTDLVERGDMHHMPYPDNYFDVLIAGWVFAYSNNLSTAIDEACRVLRPGGIISIGWDHYNPKASAHQSETIDYATDQLIPTEGYPVNSAEDIIRYFSDRGCIIEVFYKQSSVYPYGISTRRNITCFRLSSRPSTKIECEIAYRESLVYRASARAFRNAAEPNEALDSCTALLEAMQADLYNHNNNEPSSCYLWMRNMYYTYPAYYKELQRLVKHFMQQTLPAQCLAPYESLDCKSLPPNRLLGMSDDEIKSMASELGKDGYCILPQKLTEDWLECVNSHLDMCFYIDERDGSAQRRNDICKPGRYFIDQKGLQASPDVVELAFSRTLVGIAEQYLGVMPVVDFLAATYSNDSLTDVRDLDASAQLFHRDKDRISFLKFFVYLSNVDTDSGPHQVVQGTHASLEKPFDKDGRYDTSSVFDYYQEKVKSIEGQAGTIFAVDTHAIHRGCPLVRGSERTMLQIQFSTSLIGAQSPNLNKDLIMRSLTSFDSYSKSFPRLFSNCK